MNEVEKLNAIIDSYQPRLQALKVEIAELQAYKDVNEDFKTAWEELKAENERLKEKIESYVCSQNCYAYKHADKYRHILQEIKEIAETHTELCKDCDDQREDLECQELCNGYKLKQILDIIYKAEEE